MCYAWFIFDEPFGVASLPSLRILKGCGNCNDATPTPVIARLRRSRSKPDAIQVRNVWIASLPSLRVLKGRGNRNDGREYGVASLPSLRILKGCGNFNDATPTPVIARLRRSRSNPDAIQVRNVWIICDEPFGVALLPSLRFLKGYNIL